MLKFENTEVTGWQAAIRGLRNPMNSWDKSDTVDLQIGNKDLDLMLRMNATPSESKYRRMIIVTADITGPLYWWKEFDTYKVGTVANSCSTMHKIHSKEFTLDDFSHEHLDDMSLDAVKSLITLMNMFRMRYIRTNEKESWWQMIQLLPSSYNQRRTVQLNYEVISKIRKERSHHKLDEWRLDFMNWTEQLPYSQLFSTKKELKENNNI